MPTILLATLFNVKFKYGISHFLMKEVKSFFFMDRPEPNFYEKKKKLGMFDWSQS